MTCSRHDFNTCESITSSTTDFINHQIFLQSASDNAKEEEWLETDLAFDLICFMICDELKDSNSVFFHSLLMLTKSVVKLELSWVERD